MIFWWSRFQTLSRGFMSLHDACMLCPLNYFGTFGIVVGHLLGRFFVLSLQGEAASIRISNFSVLFSWLPLHHPDR